MNIVHIAKIPLNYESGMSRIASYWRDAFVQAGHQFIHIGVNEVGENIHINLWGYYACKYLKQLNIEYDILLVHEPFGGFFYNNRSKIIIFSHGIEERSWNVNKKYKYHGVSIKSMFFPTWLRFLSNNIGIKYSNRVLLSNEEDQYFLLKKKNIDRQKTYIFKNGYYPYDIVDKPKDNIYFLFNASWIERKGVRIMYKSFNEILSRNKNTFLIIAGTSLEKEYICRGFEENLWNKIEVISKFTFQEEEKIYNRASIFVLPSYFEGQSLALTQAMAMGLCPVVADNCGQKDFIHSKENGLLFNTGDSDHFTKQLQWLINNPNKINELGNNARQFVKKLYWDKVASDVVNYCTLS